MTRTFGTLGILLALALLGIAGVAAADDERRASDMGGFTPNQIQLNGMRLIGNCQSAA